MPTAGVKATENIRRIKKAKNIMFSIKSELSSSLCLPMGRFSHMRVEKVSALLIII